MPPDAGRTSTNLLERPQASTQPALEPAAPDGPAGGARSTASYAALATITTALALALRSGYSFGLFDQTVYSLRGIALADPGAFARDWFARSVPQPHWLFDATTYLGTRFGILPAVYLFYWLAGVAVFGLASVWLVDRFLPGRRAFSLALGPLVAIGPTALLGSTTPLLWFANPHMLGGCLACLTLAAILSGHWRTAAVAALAAGAVHIQHGANLAPVLLLAAMLGTSEPRRHRALLAGTAVALLAAAPLIASWRGLQTDGDEWLTICRDIIPYHCFAPSWSWTYLGSGVVVLGLALLLGWWGRHHWRTILPAVTLPTAGLLLGVVGERYQLGILGRLAEQYNVHRLATLVEPMAAVALLWLAARASESRRTAAGMLAAGAFVGWIFVYDGAGNGTIFPGEVLAVALTGLLLTVLLRVPGGRLLREAGSGRLHRPVVAAIAGTATVAVAAAAVGALGHVGYDRTSGRVETGLVLRRLLPADALVVAPPELFWVRALSQRSVIADCKAVPFGGAPWREYLRRIDALGGRCHENESQFAALSPADVEALRTSYGATHVLLTTDDPKMAYARDHWTELYSVSAPPDESVRKGLALFDLTAPR